MAFQAMLPTVDAWPVWLPMDSVEPPLQVVEAVLRARRGYTHSEDHSGGVMSWDDAAETWDDDPAVQAYSRAAFRSLVGLSGLTLAGKRVLDFGCGTGLLTVAMAAQAGRVVGFDLSEAMIARLSAKSVANVTPLAGDLADHDPGRFDLVTCSSVCAFLPDYPATAKALADLLVPGGWFVQWDWELDPEAEEPYGLSRDAIRDALAGAGLADVEVRIGFSEPFERMTMAPLMGIGRKP